LKFIVLKDPNDPTKNFPDNTATEAFFLLWRGQQGNQKTEGKLMINSGR